MDLQSTAGLDICPMGAPSSSEREAGAQQALFTAGPTRQGHRQQPQAPLDRTWAWAGE
jgi:hypothetical protein